MHNIESTNSMSERVQLQHTIVHNHYSADTQGWELKVLNGASELLDRHAFQYIQFEFSPWLMTSHNTGDPTSLLHLLPDKGAVCFDVMGEHNMMPRPSFLRSYFETLNGGTNGDIMQNDKTQHHTLDSYKGDNVGPWEDVLCWFPQTTP
jgi:hypothetical protein